MIDDGVGEPILFKPMLEFFLFEQDWRSLFTRETRWLFTYHRRDSGINLYTFKNQSKFPREEKIFYQG